MVARNQPPPRAVPYLWLAFGIPKYISRRRKANKNACLKGLCPSRAADSARREKSTDRAYFFRTCGRASGWVISRAATGKEQLR